MTSEAMIKVSNLSVRYSTPRGDVTAVEDVSFAVRPGDFYTLLGPSGCGKTTTLRSIAGLETPAGGEISLAGTTVFSQERRINVPVHAREIGMVFQSYAVWPHMSVFANVAYPLRNGRQRLRDRAAVRAKAMRALERVQMQAMAERNATELSGGQQQRVALARALVTDPKVLLLDEPLSNLDARLRADMRNEMEELVRSLGTTALYVTHDQTEALAMSDQVALMRDGRIMQEGTPRDLYDRPTSRFAAGFVGDMNLVAGRITESGPAGVVVETAAGTVLRVRVSGDAPADAGEVDVGIRPENVRIGEPHRAGDAEHDNALDGVMVKSVFVGDQIVALIEVEGSGWQVRLRAADPIPEQGTKVSVRMSREHCIAFPTA
jgi:iron(III) transport system ATP-binding protein